MAYLLNFNIISVLCTFKGYKMYPSFKYAWVFVFLATVTTIDSATWSCKDVFTDFRSHKVNAERQDRVLIASRRRSRRHRRHMMLLLLAAMRCDIAAVPSVVKCYDSNSMIFCMSVCFFFFISHFLKSKAATKRLFCFEFELLELFELLGSQTHSHTLRRLLLIRQLINNSI